MAQDTILEMLRRREIGELPDVEPVPILPVPEASSPSIGTRIPHHKSLKDILGLKGTKKQTLRERLLRGVTVPSPEETSKYFGVDDSRWGETFVTREDSPTGEPTILINDALFSKSGVTSRTPEMVTSESIHFLKFVDPERWEQLRKTAEEDPGYQQWNNERYERAQREGEERPKDVWHDVSSFDQVIGGYIFAQNPSIPTMREWNRDELPIGEALRSQLDSLAKDLGVNTGR